MEQQYQGQLIDFNQYVNEAYLPFFASKSRFCVLYGGRSAGKTYAVAQKLILNTLFYKNKKTLVCRKTFPSLRHTCLEIIRDWFDTFRIKYEFNTTEMVLYTINGNKFLFKALDDSRKFKSLTDIDFLWIDEADEISKEEFLDVMITVRGRELPPGEYRQIILTFNPGSYARWIKEMFFDPNAPLKPETEIFHFTYKDNKFLSAEDRRMLESYKEIDDYLYKVYTLGEWGVLRNRVFENYVYEDFDHPIDWYDDLFGGLDFGYNSPSAFVFLGMKDEELYVIDEIYQRKLTNTELISRVKEKLNEYQLYDLPIYADSAETDRIQEFLDNDVYVYPAKKDIIAGINLLKRYRIHISYKCPKFYEEITEYRYREDEKGEPTEMVVKENDHLMDAMRYAVYTRYSERSVPSISVL